MRYTTLPLLAVLFAAPAGARTLPLRGAAPKPRAFELRAPFPCGVMFRVNCGYGQRAHRRVRSPHSSNDYYALDFTRMEAGNGFDKPVVAVADGVVRKAGWARRGWAPYGKLVYIEHDFRDANHRRYQSLYAHLHRVAVRPGQRVLAGTVVGTMGGSSRRRLHRFGPHLHFALYRGARRFMGGGQAVVPEPLGQYEDLYQGQVMEACGRPDDQLALELPPLAADELWLASGGLDLPAARRLIADPRAR